MTLEHISYSQYNTYTRCPRSWYLGKIAQAEEKQTWYLPIGTALHSMVEWALAHPTANLPSAEEFFYPLIERQLTIEPDTSLWLAGGPVDQPVVKEKALQKLKDCFEQALIFLEDLEVWEVEYEATGLLPGCDTPVKAYVDIIGEHKKRGPVIVDWKTGSKKPKDNFQLETYAALLQVPLPNGNDHPFTEHGSMRFKGLWAMLDPDAAKARPVDLSKVDPVEVGAKYQKVVDRINRKIYKPEPDFLCKFCFHQDNCVTRSGPTPRAVHYDKAGEHGIPY